MSTSKSPVAETGAAIDLHLFVCLLNSRLLSSQAYTKPPYVLILIKDWLTSLAHQALAILSSIPAGDVCARDGSRNQAGRPSKRWRSCARRGFHK